LLVRYCFTLYWSIFDGIWIHKVTFRFWLHVHDRTRPQAPSCQHCHHPNVCKHKDTSSGQKIRIRHEDKMPTLNSKIPWLKDKCTNKLPERCNDYSLLHRSISIFAASSSPCNRSPSVRNSRFSVLNPTTSFSNTSISIFFFSRFFFA
jgi:hypothetical protein